MPLIIVETLSETPLYPEKPTESDFRTLDCIAERNGQWRYSLVSSDRHRMICTFNAPDAESIRESYRRGGTVFSRMWSGDIFSPARPLPPLNEDNLKVFESTSLEGFTWEAWEDKSKRLMPRLREQGAEWVQSYISSDRTRIVGEFNAPTVEVIREIHHQIEIPCDRVWAAIVVKP